MNQNPFSRFRLLFLTLLAVAFSCSAFAQSREGVSGGTVTVTGSRDLVPVVARSSNPATLEILQSAFTVHGGYQVVESMQDASFAIAIEPSGPTGARLVISSGVPERQQFAETLTGEDGYSAILRAVDRAIFKTSGKPGFFSGKLVFVSEDTGTSEIYTSDFLFRNMTRLTSDGVNAVRPHWSPDGDSILYTSYKNGFPDIHRLDLRNRRREVVVDFKGTNMGARYSPDGSRIALIISGGRNADVWVREANGQFRNLTKSSGLEAAPCWSPDGSRIVFSSDQNGGVQLFVVPSFGGQMRRLRTDISGYCAEPDWNPVDPNKIAFTAAMGSGYQLAVYDMNEGKSRFITSERGDAIEPQWLSDGRHIVYTHRRANSSQIKIVDTLSLKSANLSGGRSKISQPSFIAE
ncbi:hypothetical protein [Pelagicoccus sp. SDUM812003]|uniref:hypothetical protein n=1 Tax=Pelagicoccus sp. SDUM812003 TaxID=3041267 RepID=UPI00280CC4FA|nr:hypothetical protein [Pelagicoccus sp. SDUM812003]MDQ8204910.1 hypothetical protein [Pelagicoccus sp. SDUM812003]